VDLFLPSYNIVCIGELRGPNSSSVPCVILARPWPPDSPQRLKFSRLGPRNATLCYRPQTPRDSRSSRRCSRPRRRSHPPVRTGWDETIRRQPPCARARPAGRASPCRPGRPGSRAPNASKPAGDRCACLAAVACRARWC
jgi:hypothetical protein